jgi:hypothetical protein
VAASLDTAGKSALELKAHLFRRSPEDVAELEANYERQYLAALEQEKVGRAVDEQINSLSLDEVKESMMQDYGLLSSEEREQLDILLSSTDFATEASRRKHQTKYNQAEQQQQQQKKQHQQQQQQDRPKVEMSADAPLTLDDIARLVLGGSDDATLVAETRAKIENRELAVSEEIYAAAVQLMRERALATTISSEERDIVEATFNTMRVRAAALQRSPCRTFVVRLTAALRTGGDHERGQGQGGGPEPGADGECPAWRIEGPISGQAGQPPVTGRRRSLRGGAHPADQPREPSSHFQRVPGLC